MIVQMLFSLRESKCYLCMPILKKKKHQATQFIIKAPYDGEKNHVLIVEHMLCNMFTAVNDKNACIARTGKNTESITLLTIFILT